MEPGGAGGIGVGLDVVNVDDEVVIVGVVVVGVVVVVVVVNGGGKGAGDYRALLETHIEASRKKKKRIAQQTHTRAWFSQHFTPAGYG